MRVKYPALIARSVKNLADYGSHLSHFVRTNQLLGDVMQIDQARADTNGGQDDQHYDKWDPDMDAILDSVRDSEPEDR